MLTIRLASRRFRLPGAADGALAMLPAIGSSVARATAVVPAALLMLFVGVLWILGLACGESRRAYVTTISEQAMRAASTLFHGAPGGG